METQRRQHKRQRKDNKNQHIINDIPDCLLIHILSFLSAKQAVQTCILSKRWINLWKTLPTLILSCFPDFKNNSSFEQFVDQFLTLRDDSTPIQSLSLHRTYYVDSSLIQRVIEYASAHCVQHLRIKISAIKHLSSCFSSCHTLTYLRLSGGISVAQVMTFPNSLNLPALTTLSLKHFSFRRRNDDDGFVDPFSAFNMLNTLIINRCLVLDNAQNLRISSTNLVNLSITMCDTHVVPKTYNGISFGIELYTPTLHTFALTGNTYIQKLSGNKSALSSIKLVSIHFLSYDKGESPSNLLNWLAELANIESLTITYSTLEILSLCRHLSKVEFPSWYNLKSLRIKMFLPKYIPPKMVDFLLQNSPSAKVETYYILRSKDQCSKTGSLSKHKILGCRYNMVKDPYSS